MTATIAAAWIAPVTMTEGVNGIAYWNGAALPTRSSWSP